MHKPSILFKIVPIFIAITFVIIVAWYIIVGFLAVKVIDEVDKNGLKGVVERVWEGEKPESK